MSFLYKHIAKPYISVTVAPYIITFHLIFLFVIIGLYYENVLMIFICSKVYWQPCVRNISRLLNLVLSFFSILPYFSHFQFGFYHNLQSKSLIQSFFISLHCPQATSNPYNDENNNNNKKKISSHISSSPSSEWNRK